MVAKLSGRGVMAGLANGVSLRRTVALREALQHRHETKCGGRDAKRTPWGPKCGAARPYESPNGGFSYRRGWGAGVLFFRVTAPSSLPPSLNAVAHSAGRA